MLHQKEPARVILSWGTISVTRFRMKEEGSCQELLVQCSSADLRLKRSLPFVRARFHPRLAAKPLAAILGLQYFGDHQEVMERPGLLRGY